MSFDYNYTYDTYEPSGLTVFLYIAVIVFSVVCSWRLFQKAGEPGWKSIIPIYNTYTMTKLLFASGWYFLFLFVPIANIVFSFMYFIRLAKAFGKSTGFGIGLIFLPIIFLPILAFSSGAYYVGNPALAGGYNNMGGYPQQGYNNGYPQQNNGYGMPNNNYNPDYNYSSNQPQTPYTQQNAQQNFGQNNYGQNNYGQNNNNGF